VSKQLGISRVVLSSMELVSSSSNNSGYVRTKKYMKNARICNIYHSISSSSISIFLVKMLFRNVSLSNTQLRRYHVHTI
jgi:hypothetical protein